MANSFNAADLAEISNQPAVAHFRKFGTATAYTSTVFTNGMSFGVTPGISTQAWDDTGDVYDYITDETGTITFDYGQVYNQSFFEEIGNGLYTVENTGSGAQAVEDQLVSAGWVEQSNITLDLINATGTFYVADGVPAITSVTASVSGVLAAGDDYFIVVDENSKSGYSILFDSDGTATVATTEEITIVYATPSVFGQSTMYMGGKSNFGAIEGYIETVLRDGTAIRIDFYRGFFNGNYNATFAATNDAAASVTNVVISLKKDPSREEGKQIAGINRITV